MKEEKKESRCVAMAETLPLRDCTFVMVKTIEKNEKKERVFFLSPFPAAVYYFVSPVRGRRRIFFLSKSPSFKRGAMEE